MIQDWTPGRSPRGRTRNAKSSYTVVVARGNESGFVARVPALPGCVSQGRTRAATLRNIREAIEVYIESLAEDGLVIPRETTGAILKVEVAAR